MSLAIKQALSPKAFLLAIGGACLIYAALMVTALLNGGKALDTLEMQMAAQNIPFENNVANTNQSIDATLESEPVGPLSEQDLMIETSDLNASLPPAPYEGLTEETPLGDVPVIGDNNLKPFDAYKKPFVLDVKKPTIGLAVSGIGMSSSLTDQALGILSPHVSLLLSPYTDDVDAVQKRVREAGFETWMLLPLETKDFPNHDPGSLAILADGGLRFNQDNLRRVLSSTQGYAGIATYSDVAFINAKPMLNGILSDVMTRGLGFFEMNAGVDAKTNKLAINNRAPYARSSMRQREQSFQKTFENLKKTAKNNRSAVGVVEVSPAMLSEFQDAFLTAQEEGFQIVPISAVVDIY